MPIDKRMDTAWRGPAVEYYTARTKNRCRPHLMFTKEARPKGDTCVIRSMESLKLGKTNARWGMSEWVSLGRRMGETFQSDGMSSASVALAAAQVCA